VPGQVNRHPLGGDVQMHPRRMIRLIAGAAALATFAALVLSLAETAPRPALAVIFFALLALAVYALVGSFLWRLRLFVLSVRGIYPEAPVAAPVEPTLQCPSCGAPYRIGDYRRDAVFIFCSRCKGALPR
jgi:hypothetical protein